MGDEPPPTDPFSLLLTLGIVFVGSWLLEDFLYTWQRRAAAAVIGVLFLFAAIILTSR